MRVRFVLTLIVFVSLIIIIQSTSIWNSNHNYFGNTNLALGQTVRMNSNFTNPQSMQNIPTKKVHVGDINVAYKTFGKGNPILLISGSGLVMDAWDHSVLKDLSTNHRIIIFDNRGVGNTTSGVKSFSIRQFANDTVGLLDALKIQKADVLGFSMGSFIAQQLALLHPEKINKLVLYGAACGGNESIPQNSEVIRILSDFVNNWAQSTDKIMSVTFPSEWLKSHANVSLPQTKETISHETMKQQFHVVEDWFAINWSGLCSQLSKISIPTLVLTGSEDVSVPAANSLIIVQKIPAAWLVQINGAGHGLMYQYPNQFSKIVNTFLENS
jgi:pimeloyl-ACP methyl ester carboxylesterase